MNPLLQGLGSGLLIVNVCMLTVAVSIWYERKFSGRMQNRPGPTEVGPAGFLQPFADVLKLMQKEDIVPRDADRVLFNLESSFRAALTAAKSRLEDLHASTAASAMDEAVRAGEQLRDLLRSSS